MILLKNHNNNHNNINIVHTPVVSNILSIPKLMYCTRRDQYCKKTMSQWHVLAIHHNELKNR